MEVILPYARDPRENTLEQAQRKLADKPKIKKLGCYRKFNTRQT